MAPLSPRKDVNSCQEQETRTVRDFFSALNNHDADALVATLHPSIEYRFHIHGFDPVFGKDAMVEALHAIFAIFPDFHEALLSLRVGPDLAVARWRITGSLAGPFPLPGAAGGFVLPSEPQPEVAVEGVDVFELRDGLIAKKDTFADPTNWYRAYEHLTNAGGTAATTS